MKYEKIANARLWKTLREAYAVAFALQRGAEEAEREAMHADHDTYQSCLYEAEDMREYAGSIFADAQSLELSIDEAIKKPTKASLARLHAAINELLSSTADGCNYVPYACDRLYKTADEVEKNDITATTLVDTFRAATGERRYSYLRGKEEEVRDIDATLRETRKAIRKCCNSLTTRAIEATAKAIAKLKRHTNYEEYV